MGNTCSWDAVHEEDAVAIFHSRLEALAADFITTSCDVHSRNQVQSMILLDHFQRYIKKNMTSHDYDFLIIQTTPHSRLQYLMTACPTIRYSANRKDVLTGVTVICEEI